MSWQDELRELDTALAEGRISADDYRQRRDQVLSGAAEVPQTGPQSGPFAAPFRWEAANPQQPQQPQPPQHQPQHPQQPGADATQVVPNQAGLPQQPPAQDATQVVKAPQPGNPDAERTQYVRPVTPPHGAPQPNMPQNAPQHPNQAPWQMAGGNAAPPWGGGEFGADPSPHWIAQGPEVFDDKPSSGGKRVLVILAVILVLAGAGFGVWYLTSGSGDPNATGSTETTAAPTTETTTSKPKPTDPMEILLEEIPEVGGKNDPRAEVLDTAEAVDEQVMEQGEVDLLTAGGATKVVWKSGNKQPDEFGPTPDRFSVVVVPMASEEAAAKAVVDLKAYQETKGGLVFIKDPLPDMPASVVFEKKVQPDHAIYRGLWASGKNLIRVNVDQFPMAGEAGLSGSYQRQVLTMLKVFPAP
ncbi:DUF1707 domain-containing protein [Saccharothrix hoggarensis]|uniref:Flagellar basal body-associated protein FliL n=1 Tax=Saccharothrix hoggarensis TaxID=913853 RepID=A0ABW3QSW2_9PSEU